MNNVRREHRLSGRYSDGPDRDARAVTKPSAPRLLAQLERLDDIADLDVVVAVDGQTTLEALADLGRIVLEPLQRRQLGVVDDHRTVPDQPDLRVAAEQAAGHPATGDVAHLRGAEDLPDLRLAKGDLLVDRLEHALQGGLDVVDRRVDDRVVPDIHALALGQVTGLARRPHVEADDHGVRRDGQVDVVLVDRTDTAVDDPQRHLVADLDPDQRVFQRLDRTGHVALEDQQQLLGLTLLHRGHEVLEGTAGATLGVGGRTGTGFTLLGDLPGHPVVLDHQELVARTWYGGQTEHQDRTRRGRLVDAVAVLVEHGPDPAVRPTDHHRVADPQRSALHQHGRPRTTALVQVRLDRDALGRHVGVGPQVQRRVRGQHHGLEQPVDVDPGLRRDVDEHRVAAVLLRHQAVLGQLTAHLGRVRARHVDLVHRDHDRDVRRPGVVQCLDRLRHHAVVGRDHQDDDVGGLRTTSTHGGERLVTRGVDEGDGALLAVDLGGPLVGTDVLGDTAGFLGNDVRHPDRVQQLGLTVVDVTHHGHHRRTRGEVALVALVGAEVDVERLQQLAVLVLRRDDLDVVVQLGAEQLQRLLVHRLGRGHHLAEVEQHLDQRRRVDADPLGEVRQRRTARKPHDLAVTVLDANAADRRRLHVVELLALRPLRLATTPRRTARTPEGTLRPATTAVARTRTATAATGRAARATATGTEATAAATAATARTRTRATAARTAAATTGATRTAGAATGATGERAGRGLRHHRRVRTRSAGHTTRAWPVVTAAATLTGLRRTGRHAGRARSLPVAV